MPKTETKGGKRAHANDEPSDVSSADAKRSAFNLDRVEPADRQAVLDTITADAIVTQPL